MDKTIKGKYICLVCNKIFDSVGESVLHNYGDHTTGIPKENLTKHNIRKIQSGDIIANQRSMNKNRY